MSTSTLPCTTDRTSTFGTLSNSYDAILPLVQKELKKGQATFINTFWDVILTGITSRREQQHFHFSEEAALISLTPTQLHEAYLAGLSAQDNS